MYKIYCIIFLLISTQSKAQLLSYNSITQFANCTSFAQANSFVTSHNYKFEDSSKSEKQAKYIWHKGKFVGNNSDSLKTATWFTTPADLINFITVTIGTSVQQDATTFLNELAADGYVVSSIKSNENMVTTSFSNEKNKNFTVKQISDFSMVDGKSTITWFTFMIVHLMKNKLK